MRLVLVRKYRSVLDFSLTYFISVSLQRRKEILLDAFASRRVKNLNASQTPFATLVKKLQESFTRMESFEVITVAQNSDGKLSIYLLYPDVLLTIPCRFET